MNEPQKCRRAGCDGDMSQERPSKTLGCTKCYWYLGLGFIRSDNMDEKLQSVLMVAGEMIAEREREIESLRTSCNRMRLERDEAIQDVETIRRQLGQG